MDLLVLVIGGLTFYALGVFTGVYLGMAMAREFAVRKNKPSRPTATDRKAILQLLAQQTEITNNDVEKLLAVSDATATRYLDALEQAGDITQKGKTGRNVYYIKK